MKKARIISACIVALLGIALIIFVCIDWHAQGCGVFSLIAAIFMYGMGSVAVGVFFDEIIKDYFRDKEILKHYERR